MQTKTEKIHKKMPNEEHCNTLPTIGLGRPARRMGASKEAAEANAPPSNPRPSLPILPKGPISMILLAVQDSSIGDLVTHSVSESVSQVTFDFCDNDKTFERLLRDF